ncbi:hypothetical protein HOY80DRAFT_1014740 [Tuber brumale]|nr:hypothetical protein HOY80DRAFT_1014740 [Tuber brumale]
MATAKYGEEDIRRGIPKSSQHIEHIRAELDDYINFVLGHHKAGKAIEPAGDHVPNIQNVSEESFFYRNCWIPKNIQVPQYANRGPRGSQFTDARLEGEAPVTFYNYPLDGGKFEYVVMPLQYLYENYGEAMSPKESPSMNPFKTPDQNETDELVQQSLQVMEFPACYYAGDFLRVFSSEHTWNLWDRPGVSFQFALDLSHFTVAISIPYLGVEGEVDLPARDNGGFNDTDDGKRFIRTNAERNGLERSEILRRLESLEGLTDFRKCPSSWPRESSTLNQNRYPNAQDDNLRDNSVGKDFILVHRAGIILLDTTVDNGRDKAERLAIFGSCDDKNSDRVPLLPHQSSVNALDAFLNVLSNTLKSSERAVLENIRRKASDHSLDFREFAKGSGAARDIGGRLVSSSATLSDELLAVIDVVKSQKRYVKDLQGLLTGLGVDTNHPNGFLRIPSQGNEQRSALLQKICFLLEERQTFLDEVNEIFTGVKAIEKSFYQLSALKTSQDMAQRLGEVAVTTSDIRSATDGIRSTIRRLRNDTILEIRHQGRKCRKAWWKRIFPSQERPLPPPTDDD